MWQQLQEEKRLTDFELEAVDIDSDSELSKKYGTLIPVLEAEDKVLCHYYLDKVVLQQYLGSESSTAI